MSEKLEPVAWITKENLDCVENQSYDAWVYWQQPGHKALDDEVALFTAAQMRQAERDALERAANTAFDEVFAMNNAIAARHVSDTILALLTPPDGKKG